MNKLTPNRIAEEWVGQTCWSSLAFTSVSTNWSIDFGKKLKRKKPLNNSKLNDEERRYQGELTLFILSASWRLSQNHQILTGSSDYREYDEESQTFIQNQLGKKIVGETITDLKINELTLDVSISLTGNYVIDILCNCPNDFNYIFSKRWLVNGEVCVQSFEVNANAVIDHTMK